MRGTLLAGCVFVSLLTVAVCDPAEETTDTNQDEADYEDIAVAESQDIGHSQIYLHGEDSADHPRPRPRGRKRRRRLRKRPRSTTPSFIEEYDPERTAKEEEPAPVLEEDALYQRRRPLKRRRRPARRKPEYNEEALEPEFGPEHPEERLPQQHYRQRNAPRRRRKGGRKRIRVTTEYNVDSFNDTHEVASPQATSEPTEVVGQSNRYSPEHETSSERHPDETTPSILTSAFTTKEITEINHKLELLSENHKSPESGDPVSGTGALSDFRPTPTHVESTTENLEENHIISSASSSKDIPWIDRFSSQTDVRFKGEETSVNTASSEHMKDTTTNIKNIEQIIENRKSLFSTSKRLPPTSAVIRRRIRPRKHRNSTSTTQQTVIENTIPTINPTFFDPAKKPCQSVECALNITSVLSNNIIPSSLLPSGFPTMPEILSTAELIQKMASTMDKNGKDSLKHLEEEKPIRSPSSSDEFIITPSTLIRSPNDGENRFNLEDNKDERHFRGLKENKLLQTEAKAHISTSTETELLRKTPTTLIESSSMSSTEIDTTQVIYSSTYSDDLNDTRHAHQENNTETSTQSETLRLDGVDVSNINDEILELIMDEMGKARVKRILELRNMTLSELIAHRERGAGHFSDVGNGNNSNDEPFRSTTEKTEVQMEEKIGLSGEASDEEQTEEMIVEKAKHFLIEYKKSELGHSLHSDIQKTSKKEYDIFGQRLKVQGTVIPVPILEPTHTSAIQFPNDGVLGAFPNFMHEIAEKSSNMNPTSTQDNPNLFKESINKPKNIQVNNDKREPRLFESMPKFSSSISDKDDLEISPFPDWRITVSKSSTQKTEGFPGISEEIMLVARTTKTPADLEELILLDEGEEAHQLRNRVLGGKINVETRETLDEDYPEEKRVPAGVKSAIAASGALLLLAIFGFLAVLVSCKIRQRRARLRVRRDILNEQLAEDIRSSQRSLTPVLRKGPFNHGIHSNTTSNRHYYLWRTLRKTFQYE